MQGIACSLEKPNSRCNIQKLYINADTIGGHVI